MTSRRSIRTTTALVLAAGPLVLVGAAQASSATCHGLRASIVGTPGDDTIEGTRHRDVIVGRGGNDVIRGGGGNDVVCGGKGGDVLSGGRGDDLLDGQAAGRDDEGNLVPNRMLPGTGDNQVLGDPLDLGDVLDLHASRVGARVDLARGIVHGAGTTTLRDVTRVIGTRYDDEMSGSAGTDSLEGRRGDDLLRGRAGTDFMDGGPGADVVRGGPGNDDLYDGLGDDTLTAGAGDDNLHLVQGTDTVGGGGGHNAVYLFPSAGVTLTMPADPGGLGTFEGGLAGTFRHVAAFIGTDHDDTYVVPDPFLFSSLLASNGDDTIDVSGYPGPIEVDLAAGTITSGDESMSISSFEHVVGGAGRG